jgi:cation transport regulator
MPYDHNADLPQAAREHLPQHAQTIYREAFNHAW